MPKNEQFDVVFVLQALACPDQPTQEEVEEREQHGSPSQLRGERMLTTQVGSRTAISEPFRRESDEHRPDGGARMIWLTWRQHRQQALAGGIGLGLVATFFLLTHPGIAHTFKSSGAARCLAIP